MQNYNFIQKLLHDLVLNNKLVNKSLFELEKFLYLKNNNEYFCYFNLDINIK